MSCKFSIGIWGQFGGDGHVLADGQAVRTTIIYQELQARYGTENILMVNTHNWKKKPFSFLASSIKLIAQSRNILFLPADNGFKVFAPILVLCNLLFRRNLIYIVIGGFLPDLLKKHRSYLWIVKRMKRLYVQTESLKKDLKELGITEVKILSNLKRLNTVLPTEININNDDHISLCVFSRLIKEKGVEDAIAAVKLVNSKLGGTYISLDMFGVIPDSYKDRFYSLVADNKDFVTYKGILKYDQTVETLRYYFALLFPTYYYGEGFPGNVIDAYNSALPIIATNWKYNADVIENNKNGILVPHQNPQALANAIQYLYNNREIAYRIQLNNLQTAKQYHPDIVLSDLYNDLTITN